MLTRSKNMNYLPVNCMHYNIYFYSIRRMSIFSLRQTVTDRFYFLNRNRHFQTMHYYQRWLYGVVAMNISCGIGSHGICWGCLLHHYEEKCVVWHWEMKHGRDFLHNKILTYKRPMTDSERSKYTGGLQSENG